LSNESLVLVEASGDVDACSSYELRGVDGRTVYDAVVSVTADNVIELLLVTFVDIVVSDKTIEVETLLMLVEDCVDDVVSDTTVENVDGPAEVPAVLTD
jgi:hypothetical protein